MEEFNNMMTKYQGLQEDVDNLLKTFLQFCEHIYDNNDKYNTVQLQNTWTVVRDVHNILLSEYMYLYCGEYRTNYQKSESITCRYFNPITKKQLTKASVQWLELEGEVLENSGKKTNEALDNRRNSIDSFTWWCHDKLRKELKDSVERLRTRFSSLTLKFERDFDQFIVTVSCTIFKLSQGEKTTYTEKYKDRKAIVRMFSSLLPKKSAVSSSSVVDQSIAPSASVDPFIVPTSVDQSITPSASAGPPSVATSVGPSLVTSTALVVRQDPSPFLLLPSSSSVVSSSVSVVRPENTSVESYESVIERFCKSIEKDVHATIKMEKMKYERSVQLILSLHW